MVIDGFDCYDFVDPSPVLNFYFVNEQGQYIQSAEGVMLNGAQDYRGRYTIVCDDYVSGILGGSLTDYSRRKETFSISLSVADKIAPTLELRSVVTTGKVGSKIALAKYTATDDKTAEVSVYIQVIDPMGKYTVYQDVKDFTPTKSGKYRIVYCAMDEASNLTFVEYVVTVA